MAHVQKESSKRNNRVGSDEKSWKVYQKMENNLPIERQLYELWPNNIL